MKKISPFVFLSILLVFNSFKGICQTDANTPIHGITIYIDYPDAPASVTLVQLDSLINGVNYQEPGVERTFRKYWFEQTRRNFVMHHDIFFYTAPLPSTHYSTLGWQDGILLWKDALEYVIANNPSYDWNALDLSENGGLRSVMIISTKLEPAGAGGAHGPNWTLSNGVNVREIYCSVLQAPWDTSINMFMTLHEGSHSIFGFPDTYDTEYDSGGTSFYNLMSGGQNDVEPIGGQFLVEKNWGYPVLMDPGTHTITLRADGDSVVVLRNLHDSLEFFTIECRKQSTMGNSLFPVPLGLLIWHSDTKVNTSNTKEDMLPMLHYKHSIVQADGLFELENNIGGGDIGDIFLPGNSFSDVTNPSTKWWDGGSSGIEINNILLLGTDYIQFTVTVPTPHTDHYPEIPQSVWNLVSATPSEINYEGTKAFDGDINTYYHVPWGSNYPRPHELVIDLGTTYTINEFFYTANKNNQPPWEGRIENYEIYISSDMLNWGTAVATGTFFETALKQYVLFPNTTGRYLKISALNTFNNDVRTSIAEINLRGFDPASLTQTDINSDDDCRIYPNPTNGEFTILHHTDNAEITIIDMIGQQIINKQTTQKTTNIQLDVNGVYIIYVKTKQRTTTKKLIVNH